MKYTTVHGTVANNGSIWSDYFHYFFNADNNFKTGTSGYFTFKCQNGKYKIILYILDEV